VLIVIAGGLAWGLGRHINVNRFSLHAVYRNRLVRAFLGSARPERTPDPFTGFDPQDNPRMVDLGKIASPRKLFPVINVTLNVTEGERNAWSERKGESFCLLMLDIDHFKPLNDTYGHHVGDKVLRRVAHVLTKDMREVDTVARYGGEEFVIILPEISLEIAHQRLVQLKDDLGRIVVHHDGQSIDHVTVSIGIAYFPVHGRTDQGLLHAADRALYQAKELGRNRVVIAAEEAEPDDLTDWSLRPS